MNDRRDEILNSIPQHPDDVDPVWTTKEVHAAMDEYMKEVCLELLEYMAEKGMLCVKVDGESCFQSKNTFDYLSKEQLFENFL